MLGALLTLAAALAATASGWLLIRRWATSLDPAERIGLSGLLGLGAYGLLTLPIGLLPSGLVWGGWLLLACLGAGSVLAFRQGFADDLKCQKPGSEGLLWLLGFCLIAFFALVGVLTPSTLMDWDSLAYHLAVPKIWLQQGQIGYVEAIHHSNFPFVVDNLFIWGQWWGGQAGAKAFSWCFLLLGAAALFGHLRRRAGDQAGWWAMAAFAGIPVVAWESGTAYIDVAHGLYAAFAILYAFEWEEDQGRLILAGLCLGGALGSKFTGLQVMLALAVVMVAGGLLRKEALAGFKRAALVCCLGLALAAPWFAKTAILTGNPVYPFFYSVLGGRDWDGWRASIYANEQQTFGVGRTEKGRDPLQIGHAVFGLGVQPGRFVNPGQTEGMGFPTGAVGFAALLLAALAAASGRLKRWERETLAVVGIGLLLWFFLSQQTRYLTILIIPCLVAGISALSRTQWRMVAGGAVAVQLLYTAWMISTTTTTGQMGVLLGREAPEAYTLRNVGFAGAAAQFNSMPDVSRVALYNEVFGWFLDRPYIWANPGHSTIIPYETLETGRSLADALKGIGVSHAYLNLGSMHETRESRSRLLQAMGLEQGEAWTPEEKQAMDKDLNLKWKRLLADAVREGAMVPVPPEEGNKAPGLILQIQP